jgi:hypothetical protein
VSDTKFIDGLIVKAPNERAPEYVKAKLSIRREELIGFLQAQSGDWINADIKVSQGGKWYAAVDEWKPDGKRSGTPQRERSVASEHDTPQPAATGDFQDDDIPF